MSNRGKEVKVEWLDSHGVESGWKDISDYKSNSLTIESWGKIIYEDDDIISLAHNYAEETEKTFEQANGIMTIPKACITKITCVSCGQVLKLEQKQSHS